MKFSNRFNGITGSAIREILKLISKPGVISFAGGNPSPKALPDEIVAKISQEVLLKDGKTILQYGITEGYTPFVDILKEYLKQTLNFDFNDNVVLPTTGSSQAMDLLCKVFINSGDYVLAENPTFLGNLQCLKLYESKIVGVESDSDGIKIDELEKAVIKYNPKLLYIIPNFQNPAGVTLCLERRRKIAELASKYNFIVAEDDPYRDLRYSGESLPTIKSFDTTGNVVYMGSFSKIISPGLRVGYMYGRSDIIRQCTIGKQSSDVHTSNLTQAIVAEFIKQGYLKEHINLILEDYSIKQKAMLKKLSEIKNITFTVPEGGMFIFIELPKNINATQMLNKAVELGIAYVPGTYFYVDGGRDNTLRLNFTNSSLEQIEKGMETLKNLINKEI